MAMALLLPACGGAPAPDAEPPAIDDDRPALQPEPHAQVVLFMMARCPHCADLLETLLPLKRELGDAGSLSIGFIGDPESPPGDAEATSAQVELCVGLSARPEEWFGFMECIYGSGKWRRLPSGWAGCAEENGIDPGEVASCLEDGTGEAELMKSMTVSMAKGIRAAPTMFIDGRLYAGDRSRRSILRRICYLAGTAETRPGQCDSVEPPPPLPATLLEDSRCGDPKACDVAREVEFLGELLPTMVLKRVDYSSEDGGRLYRLVRAADGPRHLPLLVFDGVLAEFEAEKEGMEEYLVDFGDGYLMPLGMGWDPTAEICGNGLDDNADGAVDCADDGCRLTLPCREERPGRLDLFIMSRCPFAIEAIPSLDAFLEHMGRDRAVVDFRLQFIGEVGEDGTLDSMHGDLELEEDLRMICAQALYPKRYEFMKYVTCRAGSYTSKDWEACVPASMSAKKLSRCAQGEEGRRLLAESFTLSGAAGLDASPSWLLNDKLEMEGRTPKAILTAFCEHNQATACAREIRDLEGSEEPPDADKCQ